MNHISTKSFNIHKKVFTLLLFMLVFSVASYVYLMFSVVYKTSIRQRVEASISEKKLSVSDLESSYIEAKKQINSDTVEFLGFVDAKIKNYISKKDTGVAFKQPR